MNKIEKCSITQKDRIVIHKGDVEKRIFNNELEEYLKNGYELGISDKHRLKLSENHIGTNLGNTNGFKKNGKPWNYNKHGLQIAWNKGLTKETDERVLKYSESNIGRPGTRLGKHNSTEHNDKISKAQKGVKDGKRSPEQLERFLSKSYATKKAHNSFNSSKPENELYQQLLNEYLNQGKTIKRNYKDSRYPYYCDFYIPEEDLFIELNAHWTHGGKPYNPEDEECQKQLEIWKEKAKTSKFYENAITTWTIRDVEKQKCAKENNLNYKTIY